MDMPKDKSILDNQIKMINFQKYLPKVKNGKIKPPISKRKAPSKGPNSKPNPPAASIYPMKTSLSSLSKELSIAILATELAPPPKPPKT